MNPPIIAAEVGFNLQDEIDQLEIDVQRQLNGRVRDFRLLGHPDGLILRGRAATYHAKQLAQHAIMAATRLPICANEIEVCPVSLELMQT